MPEKLLSFYSPRGTVGRAEWWAWFLPALVVVGGLVLFGIQYPYLFWPCCLPAALLVAKVLTVSVQRVRDIGRLSMWLVLIVPFTWPAWVVFLGFFEGAVSHYNRLVVEEQSRETAKAKANAHAAYLRAVENRENRQR